MMASEKARGKLPASVAAATTFNPTPSYMMSTNAAETRRITRSQSKVQSLAEGFATTGSVKGIVIQGPGGTVQDHAARILKKTGSFEAGVTNANAYSSAPTGKASGSHKGLDSRLRARQLLRFISRPSPPGNEKDENVLIMDNRIQAVRNAIDEIPKGLERLESLVAMSTAGVVGDEAELEPFFDKKTPNQLRAYIRMNLARWLDSLVPLDDKPRTGGQADTTSPNSATTTAEAAGHEALTDGVIAGNLSVAAPPVSDDLYSPGQAAIPIPPAVAVASPIIGDSGKEASKPTSDENGAAGMNAPPRGASPKPSSVSSCRIRLPTGLTTIAAGYETQEAEEEEGIYDFPSLDDGSEAFRFCLIEWRWARCYKVLSYNNFQSVPGGSDSKSNSSHSKLVMRYAQWIQTERPADDYNPVPQWIRNEERERAQRLNLPETKYRTRWLDTGVEGLPGGGYGAWRKDSRGRWVRVLARGKCMAPKHGVFGLTGDWNTGKGKE